MTTPAEFSRHIEQVLSEATGEGTIGSTDKATREDACARIFYAVTPTESRQSMRLRYALIDTVNEAAES